MTTFEQLETRLAAALDRIDAGLGSLNGSSEAGGGSELEEERLANAQLQERVRQLSDRNDEALKQIEMLDLEMQRLRKAVDQLRGSNKALREANAAGVGDAHLINKAMMAELEALRAARAAESAEATAVISAIDTLLGNGETGEAQNA